MRPPTGSAPHGNVVRFQPIQSPLSQASQSGYFIITLSSGTMPPSVRLELTDARAVIGRAGRMHGRNEVEVNDERACPDSPSRYPVPGVTHHKATLLPCSRHCDGRWGTCAHQKNVVGRSATAPTTIPLKATRACCYLLHTYLSCSSLMLAILSILPNDRCDSRPQR